MSSQVVKGSGTGLSNLCYDLKVAASHPMVALIAAKSAAQAERDKTDAVDLKVNEEMVKMLKALADENAALKKEKQAQESASKKLLDASEARIKSLEEQNAQLRASNGRLNARADVWQNAYQHLALHANNLNVEINKHIQNKPYCHSGFSPACVRQFG